jgi:phospholipase/carboxylesterase
MTHGEITNIYENGKVSSPKSLVLLLHGLGSNGRDLISLSPYFAKELPDTVFVSPDAPFPCDMVPPGYPDSYQWFSLQDRDPDKVLKGVQTAAPILERFIEEQIKKYNVTADKTALVGFSQGTMMSLYAGPRYKEPLAGILGYSGALIGDMGANKLPIHLIHGEADDVVPVEQYHHARDTLEKAGFPVGGHTTPNLPHSIDENGIRGGATFLTSILSV